MSASAFERALRAAFDTRYAELFRYVNRLVGDRELAADITQEAFVRLYQRGSMPENVRTWLGAVATNLVRDEHRTRQRRAKLLSAAELGPAPADPPDVTVVRHEERARVRRALDSLPERSRELLLLRHEGFSYREIARAIGVAEGSIGTLLARATNVFTAAYQAQTHHERA